MSLLRMGESVPPRLPAPRPVRPRWRIRLSVALIAAVAAWSGCGGGEAPVSEMAGQAPPPPNVGGVVDSILPVEEEIRRFQASLPEPVMSLSGGEASRDALVARFVRSLERGDTLDLLRLAMTRGEFAYLYYPSSRYTRPPYRLSPELVWMQNQNHSSRGFTRLLQRYAGRPLGYLSYTCPDEPEVEGENRFWHRCVVTYRLREDTLSAQLFGSIWERQGHFKLVGFANEL